MKQFDYIIKDTLGIHARPAGLLVKIAGKFKSSIEIICNEKSADAKKLFALMGLGVKHNSSVTVKVNGTDEDEAVSELKNFFENNL